MVPRNPVADANKVLELYYGDSRGDIAFPVDPVKIALRMDAVVYEADLDPGVSGKIVKKPTRRPEIYLSADNGPQRQRFTCAHEIGHLYANLQNHGEEFAFTDYRDGRAAQGIEGAEVYANQFAAALLMPAKHVKRFVDEGMPVNHLARRFGVSDAAMAFRLKNLRLA